MITLLTLLLTLNAHACDCTVREMPELFESSTLIATVKVRAAKTTDEGKTFELEAIQVWKGDQKKKEFTVKTSKSDCAYELATGDKYLVFANGPDLYVGQCNGTKPLAEANKDILWMKLKKEGKRK